MKLKHRRLISGITFKTSLSIVTSQILYLSNYIFAEPISNEVSELVLCHEYV